MEPIAEKKRALLESTLSLLRLGADPHEMTVAEIASSAGIGKGTVYEYFKSKESLISAAMYYNLRLLSDRTASAIQKQAHFDGKLNALFDCIDQFITGNQQLLRLALDTALEPAAHKTGGICPFCEEEQQYLSAPLRDLIAAGIDENVFPMPEEAYCRMVLEGVTVAYVYTVHYPGAPQSAISARKNARRMLINSLRLV